MEQFDLRKWPGLRGSNTASSIIDQIAIDSRRIHSKNALFVALRGQNYDGHSFVHAALRQGARYALVRKDFVAEDLPQEALIAVEDPLRALQEITALYRKERKATVCAVIGSCGKTMLKDLLMQLLQKNIPSIASPESFNSQIGVALGLLKIMDSHKVAIIEAAISQPDEMEYLGKMIQPDHLIVTNLGKSRLGTLASKQTLFTQELLKLFSYVPQGNWCLFPQHACMTNNFCWEKAHPALPELIRLPERDTYEIQFPNGQKISGKVPAGSFYLFDLLQIAIKAAYLLGLEIADFSKALQDYVPEPMRIEVFKSQNQVTFINDTYTQDPMSCEVALRQLDTLEDPASKFSGKKIFLFGGFRGDVENLASDAVRLAHAIAKYKIDLLIISDPEIAHQLITHLAPISAHTEVIICKDIKQALDATKLHISPSDVVLIKGAKKLLLQDLLTFFEDSPPHNQVTINLAAVQSNIEEIRAKVGPGIRIMVMVKALAYGTDDVRIAKFLKTCGVDILGVSYVDEAVQLKQAGVQQTIFVLNIADYEAAKAVKWNLEVAVSEPDIIDALQLHAKAQNKKIKVHLHVDTGMRRFGARPEEVLPLAQKISSQSHLHFEGVMTHFACADDPAQDAFTLEQMALLEKAITTLEQAGFSPRWKHAANSSAAIRFNFSSCNMIRIGLAAYGLHASDSSKRELPLHPAISLVSRIVGINTCSRGDSVSYGRTFTVTKEHARIAVLPIGYFDGLHRNYSDKGYVLIRGKKAPMCGRICMDYMMCDITDIPEARLGDQVLLFGEDDGGFYLPPEELASLGGSIVHELMTCLGPRIRRFFIYDETIDSR